MLRVLVTYPRSEGSTFDSDYWVNTHMPLVSEKWPQAVRWEADLAGDDSPNYAAAHIFFHSMEDFGAAAGSPDGAAVMVDMANYTNVQPAIAFFNVTASS